MDIYYLGHSSFRLTTSKGPSLITDPFDSEMVGIKFPQVSAEIVTISHDHKDHNLAKSVNGVQKVIDGPGEYEVNGVSVIGISSYHDDQKGAVRGKNTIYVIEMEGVRLAHLGDLGHKLTESQSSKLGDIDVLFVPVGGSFTIDADTALQVVQSIEPNIVIPMHYNTKELNQKTFSELQPVSEFISAVGKSPEELQKLSIKQDDFAEDDQRLVVLARK